MSVHARITQNDNWLKQITNNIRDVEHLYICNDIITYFSLLKKLNIFEEINQNCCS